ncbi:MULTISPECIES: MmcQ/YjbR family DNA-binding protein [Bacteria]|uniref:MmcQ/YjbR family DNA-binding protein n=1 Tax=Lysinibacillus TaxID=400634 RepID=UPI001EF6228A|nr:MmcQ/YjbR family DNA-binding protein [Lysinibacillus fusiformis]MCG7434407.1 MmcQ/YjbR family DNA-binding protein [Lysinibacillus fusiformis]
MEKETIHANCLQLQGTTYDYKEEWQADRYLIGGKMYTMIGGNATGRPVLTLKCEPARAEELREAYTSIIPGYYMNKTHWNSIYMDAEDVPMDLVEKLIKHSYELVFSKLTKKAQQEICLLKAKQ